jgi:hydroxymethylglutaryl-CoA lyase
MNDLPRAVRITEEGPREGFQIEKGPIATARKIALIDALSQTGLDHIQIVSFVNPKAVPGMADADDVVRGIAPRNGVAHTALWLNKKGFERALQFSDRLANTGTIQLSASEKFSLRNQNRSAAQQLAEQHAIVESYKTAGVAVERGSIMAAFGCNFEGDIPVAHVVALVRQILDLASEHGVTLKYITLADTMAWATPLAVKRVVGALREHWPDLDIALHLHDTRGMAIANAYAGLEMGVRRLPVRRPPRRRRQCLHRRSRVSLRRARHRDRHRSRSLDRMRPPRRRHRRPSAARLGDEGRHAGKVSTDVILRCEPTGPARERPAR